MLLGELFKSLDPQLIFERELLFGLFLWIVVSFFILGFLVVSHILFKTVWNDFTLKVFVGKESVVNVAVVVLFDSPQ